MAIDYVGTARRLGVPEDDIAARRYDDQLLADLDYQFPDVKPGLMPLGSMIVLQERRALKRRGSILLAADTSDADQAKTPVARVVALGPVAFREWKGGQMWEGGPWAKPGDYVIVPRISDMKWKRPAPDGDEDAIFRMVLDKHCYCQVVDFDLVSKFTAVAA